MNAINTAEQNLRNDEANFLKSIDDFMSDRFEGDQVHVMTTPLVFNLVGADILPLKITQENLAKILKDKHNTAITPELMKSLPRALTDPIMIFDSYSGKDGQLRRVIVVELSDLNNNAVVVPIELNNKEGTYYINNIKSVFGKNYKKSTEFNLDYF